MKHWVWIMAAALLLTGCQAPATQPHLSVVAGLYPYAYLVQAIGGSLVNVTNLTAPGAEPHDLELTARQIIAVAESDLTITYPGFQPALDAAIDQADESRLLVVPAVLGLLDDPQSSIDPHVWLDPSKMIILAQTITTRLSELDPANQATYLDRGDQLVTELTKIDQQYSFGLTTCQHRQFITTHDAFSYLAARYRLTQIAIAGISPDAEPSPKRVAEIQDIAESNGITTVFFETLASPELAEVIAGDLGLATDVLDPIEGISDESRGSNYREIMLSNLEALRQANGCT